MTDRHCHERNSGTVSGVAIHLLIHLVINSASKMNIHHIHTFARSSILTLLLTDSARLLALPMASLSWLESLCSD